MADKKLVGTRILMVIAPDQFRDEELLKPRTFFQNEGAEVVVASTRMSEAKGMLGARFQPDSLIEKANAVDFQAVVVVGGMGSPEHLWNNKQLHKVIQELNNQKKVVAAICLSGAVLAKANVLAGKKVTVWPDAKAMQALKDAKAIYQSEHVVQDGHVITADGPEAALEFAKTIVAQLSRLESKVP